MRPLRRPVVHLIALGIATQPDLILRGRPFARGSLAMSRSVSVHSIGRLITAPFGARTRPAQILLQVIALEKSLQFQEPPTLDAVRRRLTGMFWRGRIVGQF